MSFARTKIQPPRLRPGTLVERPALEARLARAFGAHRLVLVSAAAGYGKTALLSRATAALPAGTALAWISADEGDDLHRLLLCLTAALEPFDLPWRTAPESLLARAEAEGPGRLIAAGELLDALDAAEAPLGVVVLDDLHRVQDPPLFEFLDLLLDRLSPRWTLVIATRHDPPLGLARLRASGELAEFRQRDLQFSRSEAVALAIAATGGAPAAALVDGLLQRTHGWAAGLRLGLATAGAGVTAGDRAMFDFLATEVIDQLEPGLRRFLLHCSVLPEITAARAAAVTGNARAVALMEQVERMGLFVSVLDSAEVTLKLHDLFRAALEHRLRREEPEAWPALMLRAAEVETDPARRLALQLRAGALDSAAQTLLPHATELLTAGALASVQHLLEQFPADTRESSPALQQVQGMMAWARWDFYAMAAAMRRAEAGYAASGQAGRGHAAGAYLTLALNALGRHGESGERLGTLRREALSLESRVIMLVSCLWHALDLGSIHRVGPILDELLDLLETTRDATLWYRGHPIPRLNGLPGTARGLDRFVQGALRLSADAATPLRALAWNQQGWALAWRGDVEGAAAALQQAREDSRWLGHPPNVKSSLQSLATLIHTFRDEREAAQAAARAMVAEHPVGRGAWQLWGVVFHAARVAAAFGDVEGLRAHVQHLQRLTADTHAPLWQTRLLPPLVAQLDALEGRMDAAMACWEAALQDTTGMDRLGRPLELRLHLAAGWLGHGRHEDAARLVAEVAAQVEACGLGGVLMARPSLRHLAGADWRGTLPVELLAEVQRWAAIGQRASGAALAETDIPRPSASAPPGARGFALTGWRAMPGPRAAAPELPASLSSREWEVLERIAAGDSNKLIARAFDLSPHTVKRHVANILDKLGAESRGQAAAWYRDAASHTATAARG